MATGQLQIPHAKVILKSGGKRYLKCCCTTTYVRAKRCVDGTYADYCVVKGVSLPYYFLAGGACYSVTAGNTEATTPFGTVVSAASLSGCDDAACPAYIQAKRCSDGADADLWFLASGVTLPFYFTKAGVVYYVSAACNQSNTPGTIAAGYTAGGTCVNCCGVGTGIPGSVTLTVSGVDFCPLCSGLGPFCPAAPDVNGTFTLPLTVSGGGGCTYTLTAGGVSWQVSVNRSGTTSTVVWHVSAGAFCPAISGTVFYGNAGGSSTVTDPTRACEVTSTSASTLGAACGCNTSKVGGSGSVSW